MPGLDADELIDVDGDMASAGGKPDHDETYVVRVLAPRCHPSADDARRVGFRGVQRLVRVEFRVTVRRISGTL